MEKFGEKIKLLRIKKGLSLKELGLKVNLTDTALSKIETGKTKSPGVDVAIKLADILGTDVYDLFGENRNDLERQQLNDEIIKLKSSNRKLIMYKDDTLHWLMIDSFAYSKDLWHAHKDLESVNTERSRFYLERSIILVSSFVEKIKAYYQVGVISKKDVNVLKSHFYNFKDHPMYFMLKKIDELPDQLDFDKIEKEMYKEVEEREKSLHSTTPTE